MGLYFRQLLAGREIARANRAAGQMANFVYLVGDTEVRECLAVDPAWDVGGILAAAAMDEMKVVGALVTHYHPDHCGGSLFGLDIEGIASLLETNPCKIWVNRHEAEGLRKVTGVSESDLSLVDSGDTSQIGSIPVQFIHTPGHTPGSHCFLVEGRLISGDTLFIQGCGRVDLPGGNAEQMYESLTQKLAALPDDTVLFPGHDYADRPSSTLGDEKRSNVYLKPRSLEDWLRVRFK